MMIPIAEARALIVAQRGGSVGAAQKTLRQAGVSGEVRGQGVHLGMPYQITAGDWTAEINFEAGIFDYYCGALGKAAFGKIGEAKVDEDDLIAWLGVKPRGYRMSPEQTAVEALKPGSRRCRQSRAVRKTTCSWRRKRSFRSYPAARSTLFGGKKPQKGGGISPVSFRETS